MTNRTAVDPEDIHRRALAAVIVPLVAGVAAETTHLSELDEVEELPLVSLPNVATSAGPVPAHAGHLDRHRPAAGVRQGRTQRLGRVDLEVARTGGVGQFRAVPGRPYGAGTGTDQPGRRVHEQFTSGGDHTAPLEEPVAGLQARVAARPEPQQ